ncbi:MAG: P-II family nitrogen regulator [Enterococcus sp.]
MKKVEAIIREEKLEELKEAAEKQTCISGMTVTQALGYGNQKGMTSFVRGQEVIAALVRKIQVTFVVPDAQVDAVIDFILGVCQTDEVGDGKIFVSTIDEVIRIRTNERGKQAI